MKILMTAAEIEAAAKRRGWKVVELCRRAGINHNTFYRWLAGERIPRIDTYEKLVRAIMESGNDGGTTKAD